MGTLHENWFIEDLQDFEYKKYLLLAYLQDVHKQFNETRLYPGLSDLVKHYRNLKEFHKLTADFYNQLPNEWVSFDLKHFQMAFSKAIQSNELMDYLNEIIEFSIPEIKKHLDEGKEIYEFIEKEIQIQPIGIMPVYKQEGYLMVKNDSKQIRVYEYAVKFFTHDVNEYRSIETEFISSYPKSVFHTWENIKIDLIRNRKKLPNPATFSIETNYEYPLIETIMPVAKRMLVHYLA